MKDQVFKAWIEKNVNLSTQGWEANVYIPKVKTTIQNNK